MTKSPTRSPERSSRAHAEKRSGALAATPAATCDERAQRGKGRRAGRGRRGRVAQFEPRGGGGQTCSPRQKATHAQSREGPPGGGVRPPWSAGSPFGRRGVVRESFCGRISAGLSMASSAEVSTVLSWGAQSRGVVVQHDVLQGRPVSHLAACGETAVVVAERDAVVFLGPQPVRPPPALGLPGAHRRSFRRPPDRALGSMI